MNIRQVGRHFGDILVFASVIGMFLSLIWGLVQLPECGPWLNGAAYSECLNSGGPSDAVILALVASMALGFIGVCLQFRRRNDGSS